MSKKVVVIKDKCISCGLCTQVASNIFAFAADGLAENVLGNEVPDDLASAAEEAASACPVAAIEVA